MSDDLGLAAALGLTVLPKPTPGSFLGRRQVDAVQPQPSAGGG
jgi:hypothetical protein